MLECAFRSINKQSTQKLDMAPRPFPRTVEPKLPHPVARRVPI